MRSARPAAIDAFRVVARAAGRPALLRWVGSAILALVATLSGYALIGVAAGFLAACATATLTHNNAFAWVYPSAAIRALAITRVGGTYGAQLAGHRAVLDAANNIKTTAFLAAGGIDNTRDDHASLGDMPSIDAARTARAPGDDASTDRAAGVILTDADAAASMLVRTVTPLAGTAVSLLATCLLLARYSAGVATAFIILTCTGCAVSAMLSLRAGSGLTAAADEAREQMHAVMNEAVLGRMDLMAAGVTDRRRRHAAAIAERYESAVYSAAKLTVTAEQLILVTGTVAQLIVLTEFRASAATVVALTVLAGAAVDVAAGVPAMCRRYVDGLAASRRLSGLIGSSPRPQADDESAGTIAVSTVRDGVQVSRVACRVDRRIILRDLSFDAAPGQTVRVTGESGSGKTTLLRMLAGEVQPSSGFVRLNGKPPNPDTATYVGPDDYILGGTVEANLRMGAPCAAEPEMASALAIVGLVPPDRAVEELLNVDVGVGGGRLSGGQRGRLAVARAVLRRPDLLLLDEPNRGLGQDAFEEMLRSLRTALPVAVFVVAVHDVKRALGIPVACDIRIDGHGELQGAFGGVG